MSPNTNNNSNMPLPSHDAIIEGYELEEGRNKRPSAAEDDDDDNCRSEGRHGESQTELVEDHPRERRIDEERLHGAVADAGRYAYGIVAVEVWTVDDGKSSSVVGAGGTSGKLVRPAGGWWRNPHYEGSPSALSRLENPDDPDYVPAEPVSPGVCLAGTMWSYARNNRSNRSNISRVGASIGSIGDGGTNSSTVRTRRGTRIGAGTASGTSSSSGGTKNLRGGLDRIGKSTNRLSMAISANISAITKSVATTASNDDLAGTVAQSQGMIWWDVRSLLSDPDTPKTDRMGLLVEAGLCKVSAVPFGGGASSVPSGTHRADGGGVVLNFARSAADASKLEGTENQVYMKHAADVIGVVVASTEARRACVAFKRSVHAAACRRVRGVFTRNAVIRHMGDSVRHRKETETSRRSKLATACTAASDRSKVWWSKCWRGGQAQIPPPMPLRQCIWTWLGVFCGMMVLSTMNELTLKLSDRDYFLLIGPFGALMTLMYGLTSAPASQPRNAILGQAVSGAIALAWTYVPDSYLPTWLRRAVGPAFSITAMVKLGIPHPPAGAHSVLYSSGQYNWTFYAIVVLATAISVLPATIVNNLSTKRQYPTYWGYWVRYLSMCWSRYFA